ncbi:CDK5 regulatory subunit-associated protein 2 isoform X2 [Ornithorhynchus anatinus]|uniref:CDK5 regulatory subunit-associated protein 2 isoform X2 n=1 Tax=Ornithorhynchus anatinus TaxID=9258 RepID=UPI0010A938C0|nr:CDK5 regulatory subunit-associated protein 2 isoform X2 [Ornithorhynchus anatinus]
MDSLAGEDPSLPVGLGRSSILIPNLPERPDDEVHVCPGSSGLPISSEEAGSPTRARNMRDYENQITDLKKENFNLKLRIYFLEERMQQKFDGPTEDIYKINIELKVELESLKRELQKREHLLIKASKAVESLTESGGSEIQCVKEEARKKLQQVEDLLTGRIRLLEEDVKAAQAEVEKAFEIAEKEKVLRMNLEEKLSFAKNPHQRDLDVVPALEEKDRLIEELTLSLKNKEALIQHLQEEKSQMESPDGSLSSEKVRELTAALKQEKDCELEAVKMEFRNERNCFEKRMQSLQEDLQEKECEIALEKKNGLKRDKTIQGLTIALKAKEKETEELSSEIEDLISSLAKQREAAHRAQLLKFKGAEDYQIALMEKETVLAELQSDNLTKDTENRKLVRRIKWLDQELNDLRQEREKMEKELDEAQLQKSRGDKTINDLRNQVEKLHGEMIEKEKAVEHHYNILLSESNQKLHSQELAIKHLTDSVSQKDILLQRLDGMVKEKDAEHQQLLNRLNHLLKAKEDLELRNEGLITEKCTSQQSAAKDPHSEENKESEYEELIHALRKEKHIYSSLVKALKDSDSINSLQAELSNIFALRKQLEDDVLAYRNLRKVLEEQIREIGRREEETFSFCGDQTSYLSICLGEHDRFQTEHLSLEELKKRVIELVLLVKDLHADNQNLKKSLLELSRLTPQETETSVSQNQCLDNKEDEAITAAEGDEEKNDFLREQHLGRRTEATVDYFDGICNNRNEKNHNQKSARVVQEVAGKPVIQKEQSPHEGEPMNLCSSLLSENENPVLESRPELMKALRELLLGPRAVSEQKVSGEDSEDKNEKNLKESVVQLRAEIGHLKQVGTFLKEPVELQSTLDGKGGFYLGAVASMNEEMRLLKIGLKDAAVQTVDLGGHGLGYGGKGDISEEARKCSESNAELDQEAISRVSEHQKSTLSTTAQKSDKKSRLPIPLKPSRSLGSVNLTSATQETAPYLPNQIGEPHGDLKEYKTRNKQLRPELSATEAMIEKLQEHPVQDRLLLNAGPWLKPDCQEGQLELKGPGGDTCGKDESELDKDPKNRQESEPHQDNESDIMPPSKDCRPEDFPDEASSVSYTSSKSFFSPKGSLNGTAIPEDVENLDDLDYLQERIKGLKSELEKYQKVVFQLQVAKQSQCREAIDTVLGGTEEAPEGQDTPRDRTEDKEMKMSPRFHQLPYEKWAEIPNPPASEVSGERIVENLKQQLEDRETELEKEQAAKMTLLGELCSLQTKLREMSPSRYDSLVQSQARELSSQRQQIKDSLSICVSCRQHMTALIKALEELLQASDVDYRVADGIREQLNRSVQLFEKLEKMFLNGESSGARVNKQSELTQGTKKTDSLCPDQSPMPSDCEVSEKSSVGSPERKPGGVELEKISVLASNFSQVMYDKDKLANRVTVMNADKFPTQAELQSKWKENCRAAKQENKDLLMEHLQEIRTLRKRLEESIKTNDRLRKQLERQGTELETGSANIFIHGSEQHNSLTSEIHFLRKQNQALNVMLAKGSRDKQKENEKLRESLSKKDVIIEHLHRDYECVKKENERLQKQVSEKEKDNRLLTHEIYSNRNELNRLQTEMNVKQQQLSANDKLLQSLRVELKVYEKLDEASRRPIDPRQAAAAEECRKDQNNLLDLAELLTEIQSLRVQLERSIETNNALRRKLEEQLSKGERELEGSVQTLNINHLSKQEWQHCRGNNAGNELSLEEGNSKCEMLNPGLPTPPKSASETPLASVEDLDSSSCCSSGSASSSLCTPPRLVPGHRMWANKNGRHILGLIEDYNALRKQISEGQKQLSEMETHLLGITGLKNQETGFKVPDQASLNSFSASVNTAQQILEEAARLLKLLWRVSLPINGHCTLPSNQGEEMKAEVIRLRKKMSEQEKKLHCTVKNLQLRKHQEKVIFDQC